MTAQHLPLDAADSREDDSVLERAFMPTLLRRRTAPPTLQHALVEPPGAAQRKPSTLPGVRPGADPAIARVGRYEVCERLGRGGMATVFRAHDPSIGRDVALKFLHASLCQNADCHGRFLREARAAGGLSHPHIVVVHDVGEIDGRPYMAMELLTGGTLADSLAQGRGLPLHDAVNVALQIALALDYAHQRGVVHRDIKPANIMLDGSSGSVKLADFGIAHLDEAARDGEQRTRIGDILGTPQYMSPEQTRGEKLDGRSDLFSVGIVLYQMITGLRPFRGESLVRVAAQIAKEEPTAIARLRGDVPPALRRVVERCLAKEPARRFQSGRELAEALTRVRLEMDEQARRSVRPRTLPLRVKWALAMSLVVAMVMGTGAAGVVQHQRGTLMAQTLEHGTMLARFSAAQNAAALLGEDWESLDVALQATMKSGRVERLAVIDLAGTVRASSQPRQVGQAWRAPPGPRQDGALRYAGSGGEALLGFEAPVTFQGRPIGQVFLGLPQRPQGSAGIGPAWLLGLLAALTLAATGATMMLLAHGLARPVRQLSEAMAAIARGRFDHRIDQRRQDEFGALFVDFDAMAQALQDRLADQREMAAGRPTEAVPQAGPT
jgi:eukaryotic-like serine/threonine-protein kinase